MTYQELMDLLSGNQAAYANMQAPSMQSPTLDQIISGIQSQYQQPAMSVAPASVIGSGASRFVDAPQVFSQQEFTPAIATNAKFVPSEFDINKYTTQLGMNDIAEIIQSGGDSGYGASPANSNSGNWGNALSLGTVGKGALAMLSMNPFSMLNTVLSANKDMATGTYGTTTTNPDGSRTISGYIQGQPFSYTEAPSSSVSSTESISDQSSAGSEPGGYGTGDTSGGFGEGQY